MDWATLQTDLPPFLATLLGIGVEWGDQPRTMSSDQARAFIDLLEPEALGVDDRTRTTVAGPAVVETVTGQRLLTVQVTVHSLSQKIEESARFYLERLRARLHWTTSINALAAMGLALATIGTTIEVDPTEDMRVRSVSIIEIRCAYVHSESDAAAPFIETARVYSEYARNAAGAQLPASVQMDEIGPEV